ncbi:MAG: primosomal protein N' [bacterium]|nr:primosomal protein N' [bacterium]
MYIIDVIPLAFVPRNQSQILSYFNKEPLERGAVVEVALGRQKIKGVVIGSDNIKNRKLDFKKSVDFSLKNISKVVSKEPIVSGSQLEIARWMSNYYYAPLGVCLKTVLPPFWMKKKYQACLSGRQVSSHRQGRGPAESGGSKYQALNTKYLIPNTKFLTTKLKQHELDYKNDIDKTLQDKKQVFLLVAENTAGNYFLEAYKKYNPVFISSDLSNKEYYKIWQDVDSGNARLIIGTRIGLFLPFKNLGLIIVDDESNEFYKSDMMPRYSGVELAELVAGLNGVEVIRSAVVPRVESQVVSSKYQVLSGNKNTKIIDMVQEIKAGNFSVFSRELKESIFENIEDGKNTILYIPRRGLANFIICEKCGYILKCPNCTASLVPHEASQSLFCHHCNHQEPKPKLCSNCGSYKLKLYGLGIEKAEKELKKLFEYTGMKLPEVFHLDSDSTKNDDKVEKEVINKFMTSGGGILLATQILFSHKYYVRVPLIGIINGDTLINIPDFKAEESLFRQIYTLKSMADELIVQTHNPEDVAIKLASKGSLEEFATGELENRKEFAYPPFAQFIKLTYRHKNPVKARNEAKILAEKLKYRVRVTSYELRATDIIGPTPAFISRERGMYVWNIILKTQDTRNNNQINSEEIKKRNELLRMVPAGWLVDVEPVKLI